jgi:hypothetical protein
MSPTHKRVQGLSPPLGDRLDPTIMQIPNPTDQTQFLSLLLSAGSVPDSLNPATDKKVSLLHCGSVSSALGSAHVDPKLSAHTTTVVVGVPGHHVEA